MYKIVKLVILGLIVVFYSCNRETEKNDLQKNQLKGKVKSVKETSYVAEEKFGKIVKGIRARSENSWNDDSYLIFNENGNEIENNFFNSNGSLRYRTTSEYNDEKISTKCGYTASGKLDYKWIYKYDNNDRLVEMIPNKESFYYRWKYVYDDNGNQIEANKFSSSGSYDGKTIRKYDKDGNVIEESEYNSDGKLKIKLINLFDEKGNKLEENRYNPEGEFIAKWKYKYDNNDNAIVYRLFDSDGLLKHQETYKYNDNGNELEYVRYHSDGSVETKRNSKYEYDKKGNWIKKIEFINEKPEFILEREIEYYE